MKYLLMIFAGCCAFAQQTPADKLRAETEVFSELVSSMNTRGVEAKALQAHIDKALAVKDNVIRYSLELESPDTQRLDSILSVKDEKVKIELLKRWKQDRRATFSLMDKLMLEITDEAKLLLMDIKEGTANWDDPYYVGQDYVFVAQKDLQSLFDAVDSLIADNDAILKEKKKSNKK